MPQGTTLRAIFGASAGAVVDDLPTRSMDFENSSSQSLTMSSANFGSYDRTKFAISVWTHRESTGVQTLYADFSGSTGFTVDLAPNSFNFTQFYTSTNGVYQSAAFASGIGVWRHFYFKFDTSQSAGNKMRLWIDGVEDSPVTETDPVGTPVVSSSGVRQGTGFDGLLYQPAMFSGTLPDITNVYNSSTSKPKELKTLPGLFSLLPTDTIDVLEDDFVIATNWTNNNGVIKSTTIP